MNKIPIEPERWWGQPKIKQCEACPEKYEYYKSGTYPGKSSKLCPRCQQNYKEQTQQFAGNMGHRNPGHKTRQQHKRVNPRQS